MRDPTTLGTVEDVTGSRVSVKLAEETAHGLLFVRGEGYRVGQVGSFVRIPAGYVDLYGIVAQVGAGAAPPPIERSAHTLVHDSPTEAPVFSSRWLRVELVGEGRRGERFERGISQCPSIGDSVHVVTESDLRAIYAPGDEESHVAIGRVASSGGIPAFLDVNRLINRHCAVVGSTGAGKSTAIASLLAAISKRDKFPAARVILLDLHGEYARAFGDQARVFRINADTGKGEHELQLPFWALNAEEFMALAMPGNTASAFVIEQVTTMRRAATPAGKAHGLPPTTVTADTPLPFCVHQLWYDLFCRHYGSHTVTANQNQNDATLAWEKTGVPATELRGDVMKVQRPTFRALKNEAADPDKVYKGAYVDQPKGYVDALEAKLRDPRLKFLFEPGDWTPQPDGSTNADLDGLLEEWLGADAAISVFDLSGIPATILDDLVGALLRILFDSAFWGRARPEGMRARPVLAVLEEAHLYLGAQAKGRASVAARRVAKEGRKYGVGLMLVSQRPSEIDPTILSQCGTTVALRLTNEQDRGQIRACAADNLEGLFGMLPILRTGEALIVGEAVSMPVRALIALPAPGQRPQSEDPLVVVPKDAAGKRIRPGGWTEQIVAEDYQAVVEAWRRQNPNAAAPAMPAAAVPKTKTIAKEKK